MSEKIAVQVIDDEAPGRDYVASLVNADSRFEVVATSVDGITGLDQFQILRPDALFVDLQMPMLNGFQFCEKIDVTETSVVFVTAHGEHALQAFDFQPVDFVTKPIRSDRFQKTLQRVFEHVEARKSLKRVSNDQTSSPSTGGEQRCVVHTTRGDVFYDPAEIQFVESSGNYVKIWIQNQYHLVRDTFQHFCDNLECPEFIVVHRSFAVNLKHVRKISTTKSGGAELTLENCGTTVPVSRSRRSIVTRHLESITR